MPASGFQKSTDGQNSRDKSPDMIVEDKLTLAENGLHHSTNDDDFNQEIPDPSTLNLNEKKNTQTSERESLDDEPHWEFPTDFMDVPQLGKIWGSCDTVVRKSQVELRSYEHMEDVYSKCASRIQGNFGVKTVLEELHYMFALMTKVRSNESLLKDALEEKDKTIDEINRNHLNDPRVLKALELANSWRNQVTALQQDIEGHVERSTDQEEKVHYLEERLATNQSTNKELLQNLQRVAHLTNLVRDLELQKATGAKELEDLKVTLAQYTDQKKSLHTEGKQKLIAESEFLSKDMALSKLEQQKKKLKETNSKLAAEKDKLQNLLKVLNEKLDKQALASLHAEAEMAEFKNTMKAREAEIRRIKTDKKLVEEKQSSCSQKMTRLDTQHKMLLFQQTMTQKEKREVEMKGKMMDTQLKGRDNQLFQMGNNLAALRATLITQEKTLYRTQVEGNSLKNEVERLKSEIEVLTAKASDKEKILSDARAFERKKQRIIARADIDKRHLEETLDRCVVRNKMKDVENSELDIKAKFLGRRLRDDSNKLGNVQAKFDEEHEENKRKDHQIRTMKKRLDYLERENETLLKRTERASLALDLEKEVSVMKIEKESADRVVRNAIQEKINDGKKLDAFERNVINRSERIIGLEKEMMALKKQVQDNIDTIETHRKLEPTMKRMINDLYRHLEKKDMEIAAVLYQRDVFGIKLVQRNTEVDLLRIKMGVMERIITKGQMSYQTRLQDIRLLSLENRRLNRHLEVCKRTKEINDPHTQKKKAIQMEKKWCLEACKRKASEELTLQRFGTLRYIKTQDKSMYEMLLKMHRLTKMLIGKTDELVACQEELHQKTVCLSQLKQMECRRQDVSKSPQLSEARAVIRAKTSALKAITAENNMNRSELKKAKEMVAELTAKLRGLPKPIKWKLK